MNLWDKVWVVVGSLAIGFMLGAIVVEEDAQRKVDRMLSINRGVVANAQRDIELMGKKMNAVIQDDREEYNRIIGEINKHNRKLLIDNCLVWNGPLREVK